MTFKSPLLGLLVSLGLCAGAFDPSSYSSSYEVPLSGMTVYWSLQGSDIRLALRGKSTGFIAFGLAEPTVGGMAGADMFIASVVDGVPTIEDRHATEKATPSLDDCQDWILEAGEEANGFTVVEVTRKLVTGDMQDREIKAGNTVSDFNRIIVARSDSSETIQYHGSNRWSGLIHFGGFQPSSLEPTKAACCKYVCDVIKGKQVNCVEGDKPNSDITQVRLRNDFVIPSDVTTYEDADYNLVGLLQQVPNGVHIIGMEAQVTPATKEFVHHFTIQAEGNGRPSLWAWVPGNGPYVLPEVAGIRLHQDGVTGHRGLIMQTHFDNPTGKAGTYDQSGIDLYVTQALREHDAGMMIVGDPNGELFGSPIEDRKHTFNCPSTCTSGFTGPVTVIGNMFHMHRTGTQMWTKQSRNGVLVDEWRADFYDYAFENYYPRPRTIKPGDSLEVSCIYNKVANIKFGEASSEEMCMDFIAYYPLQKARAGQHCGTGTTCGAYTKGALGSGKREPVPFGVECGGAPPEPPSPEPSPEGSDLTGAASRANLLALPAGLGLLMASITF